MITKRELTQDNIRAFGIAEAAKILKKQRVPFAIAYWLIFGKAPRPMHPMTYDIAYGLVRRFLISQNIQPQGL
jgi:hypothetical protein